MENPRVFFGIMALLSILLAVKVGSIGLALWFDLTYPRAIQLMRRAYQVRGRRCFAVGLVNAIVLLFITLLLMNTKALALLGILIGAALWIGVMIGYGIGYHAIGLRLYPDGEPKSSSRVVLIGGAIAEAAFLAPVAGQLLSLGILFRGLGAVIISLLNWRRVTHEADAVAAQEAGKAVL